MRNTIPKWVQIVGWHFMAWAIYLLLYATVWRDLSKSFQEALLDNVLQLPVKVTLVYMVLFLLVPRYLIKKKYWLFALTLLGVSMLATLLNQWYLIHILGGQYSGDAFFDLVQLSKRFTHLNSPLLVALTITGIQLNANLSNEKLAAELTFLKHQLQPHFFFNTLNNLYGLVLNNSKLAPDLILRLSALMRYILYDSNKETVELQAEVNFIMDYVAIEQLRYGSKVTVTSQLPDKLPSIGIPPLILFTFIENAFKHGVSQEIEQAWIDFSIDFSAGRLTYQVKNSIAAGYPVPGRIREGIGLSNTQRRLTLMFGDKQQISCRRLADHFEANLSVTL